MKNQERCFENESCQRITGEEEEQRGTGQRYSSNLVCMSTKNIQIK